MHFLLPGVYVPPYKNRRTTPTYWFQALSVHVQYIIFYNNNNNNSNGNNNMPTQTQPDTLSSLNYAHFEI